MGSLLGVLEAGAGGIMAAQVRNARQADEIVRWAKFHPQGLRGVNGTGVDGRYGTYPGGEYFRRANAESVVAKRRSAPSSTARFRSTTSIDS